MDGGTVASLLIELSWPAKQLSPNARVHHMALYRAKKEAKESAFWVTRATIGRNQFPHDGTSRLAFVITAYPPDKRSRDDDNLTSAMKPARDGIAKALGVDDKFFDQRLQWGEPVNNGKIVVEVRS